MNRRWLLVMVVAMLTGCEFFEHRHHHDPYLALYEATQDNLFPRDVKDPSERDLNSPSAPPAPQLTKAMQTPITLSVTPTLTLNDIFQELTLQSQTDVAFGPELNKEQTGLTYSAHAKPLIEIIEDICLLTQLRFQIRGNLIFIEPDTPFLQTYQVGALAQTRKSENRISVTTDVFTVMENSKSRTDNGSDSLLTASGSSDFWGELETNLKTILAGSETANTNPTPFTFHKQAGLVTIFATASKQEQIRDYLAVLQENMDTQVLIEAKIIEVNLYDEFQSGINWSILGNTIQLSAPMGTLSTPGILDLNKALQRDTFTFSIHHKDFSSVLNLVQKFGKVRTLSNPRLTVMNNQPAMLKVATNEVFFQLEFDRYFQADGKPDVESFSSHIMTVPIGLVLVVQPTVNHQTGEVTMTLRPTVSRIEHFVEDPAVAIKSNQKVTSRIPVVQVREIDSVLTLKTGEVLILGGLMEDKSRDQNSSVPFIGNLPVIGPLFQGKDQEHKVTELVLFLTASIITKPKAFYPTHRIYNVYSNTLSAEGNN